jgi:hypothetical protein
MALLILLNSSGDAVDPLSAFLGLMKSVDCTAISGQCIQRANHCLIGFASERQRPD